jgi:gliding motility-associated-like protein
VYVIPAFSQPGLGKVQLNKTPNTYNTVACQHLPADFKVDFNVCDQYQVDFTNKSLSASAISWNFGDGATSNANESISHVYNAEGVYSVMLVVMNQNGCFDTISKDFLLSIDRGHIFATKELSVCKGASFRMDGDPDAVANCWSPVTYLSSFDIFNPVCTPLAPIDYQYNIITKDPSVISNGNFSNGNTGFLTEYVFDSIVNTKGHYFVGPRPRQWNPLYDNCLIDTTIVDTMMIVNGATTKNLTVWEETVDVAPNTNYMFTYLAQSLTTTDSLVLEVSINHGEIIGRMRVPSSQCGRLKYGTTWFSGADTSVNIRITDLDIDHVNNNFSLDSISLRPIYLKTDSIHIFIKPPPIFSVQPSSAIICHGESAAFIASGGDVYAWYPAATVAQPDAPVTSVFPTTNTTYTIIITESTCNITDSVFATVYVKPLPIVTISKSNDVNCVVVQSTLNATGGISYYWQPESTLSNPYIASPIATPHETTIYNVQVTGENGCIAKDSVEVKVITGQGNNVFSMPNAFTPNNDGLNDCFGVRKWGNVANLQFSVYNRWGDLMFYTTDDSNCWDGIYKNIPQPPGTYVYFVKGNTICGYVERKGTMVLIR